MKFSVLLSVYKNEKPSYLKCALESIVRQTLMPNEIVIIEDGPLTEELYSVIKEFEQLAPVEEIRRVIFDTNRGLGLALRDGLRACSYEYVARMDTDDIALPHRFEQQVAFLEQNPGIALVGCWIKEFKENPDLPDTITKLPLEHNAIAEYAKTRNPFRHMTVMYKKSAVLNSGNYRDFPLFEDYDLWIRMLQKGYAMANLPECLVMVRADDDMFARRGGISYIDKEIAFQRFMYRSGFIGMQIFLSNLVVRTLVRLLPNGIRVMIYKKVLRQTTD